MFRANVSARTMKRFIFSLLAVATLAHAETTVTMTGVHNCCKSCTNGIVKAGTSVGKDITVTAEGKTVTITTKKKTDAKKAVEAILAAGYYGSVEGEESTASKTASKPEAKIAKATVSGVHLCCTKCADAAIAAVKNVSGITSNDIVAKSESFTVEGDFTKAELTAALNAAGFAGEIK
jgi:copper chaperone CopZ